jgi:hypothetical protein
MASCLTTHSQAPARAVLDFLIGIMKKFCAM